jgi:hypothetical protein
MTSFTTRYFLSLGNVAFSLVLGVLALAGCALLFQETTLEMLKIAGSVREWIVSRTRWPQVEIIARLVLHESSILLVFFTLLARVVIGLVILIFSSLFLSER